MAVDGYTLKITALAGVANTLTGVPTTGAFVVFARTTLGSSLTWMISKATATGVPEVAAIAAVNASGETVTLSWPNSSAPKITTSVDSTVDVTVVGAAYAGSPSPADIVITTQITAATPVALSDLDTTGAYLLCIQTANGSASVFLAAKAEATGTPDVGLIAGVDAGGDTLTLSWPDDAPPTLTTATTTTVTVAVKGASKLSNLQLASYTDWRYNRDQIISRALRIVGVLRPGATASATQLSEGAESLNSLVKSLSALNQRLWAVLDRTATLTVGGSSLALPIDTLDVNGLIARDDGYDQEVKLITSLEYQSIVDKATTGVPLVAFFDKNRTAPRLVFWPVPDEAYELRYRQTRRAFDFDASTDTPDWPVEWTNALIYALAADLADDYQLPIDERRHLQSKAKGYIADAKTTDVETDDDTEARPSY